MTSDHRTGLLPVKFFLVTVLIFGAGLFPGCEGQRQTCLVTGSVHWEGKPVYPGSIVFTSTSGEPFVGNLTSEGKFFVQTGPAGSYKVSVQVHELSGLSRRPNLPSSTGNDSSSSEPKRREDTVPAQFQSANIDIPAKYRSADSSGLSFDISSPETELGVIKLVK